MRVEFIGLCRFYHRIDLHTGIRPSRRITEEPVLTAYYQWTDTVLTKLSSYADNSAYAQVIFILIFCRKQLKYQANTTKR